MEVDQRKFVFGPICCLLLLHASNCVSLHNASSTLTIKSLFLDYLPAQLNEKDSRNLEIRTPFSGSISVVESAQFGVSVNISASNALDLAGISADYSAVGDTIFLQLKYEEKLHFDGSKAVATLGIAFGTITAVVFVATAAYLCFWASTFDLHKDTESEDEHSSDRADNEETTPVTPSNGDAVRDVVSDRGENSSNPTNTKHYPKRRQRAALRNPDISSSEEISSIEDSWNKRKLYWRKGQGSHHPQKSDADGTSADAGFSSSNEYQPRVKAVNSKRNSSLDELEWDEYDEGDVLQHKSLTTSWQFGSQDHSDKELPWPPPLDEPLLAVGRDDSHNESSEADPLIAGIVCVNREFYRLVSGDDSEERNNALIDSPVLDDGYETGAAIHRRADVSAPTLPLLLHDGKAARSAEGGGSSPANNNLHMAVMVSISVLCLVSGVSCFATSEPRVHIVILLPKHFLREVNLFVNSSSKIYVDSERKPEDLRVNVYDVDDPVMGDVTVNICDKSKQCEHGCNRKSGACVCNRGFVLFESVKCTDKSDCLFLPCLPTETCTNTIGSFICSCNPGLWRNQTGHCVACASSQCPDGMYEAQSCPDRVCLGCRTRCPDETYITGACSLKEDMQCSGCRPPCSEDEFEYKPCAGGSNRICKAISEISEPSGSRDVIFESVANRISSESLDWLLDKPYRGREFVANLLRGNNIQVKVSVTSANLYPVVQAVVHSDSNDNADFAGIGADSIVEQFCPYPLPLKYELLPVLHSNVTAAKQPGCTDCPVDPRKPCTTYKQFGRQAPLNPFNKSMVCSDPDALTEIFDLQSFLTESRSINVQPSESCAVMQAQCDGCARRCAEEIASLRSGNCSVTGEDSENGWSPRLMFCQSCCLTRQCTGLCQPSEACKPVSCWNGNIAEFMLTASFPRSEFACHVKLVESVPLITLDYSVTHNKRELGNYTVSIYQDRETITGNIFTDGLLTIKYSTGVTEIPDIIQGQLKRDSSSPELSSGLYAPVGLASSKVAVARLDIVPVEPFAFSTKWWKEQNCSQSLVNKFLTTNMSAVRRHEDISVSKIGLYTYSLWNRTRQPSIRFSIPAEVSVIRKLYPPASLNMPSVSAQVQPYAAGWKILVAGSLTHCPGFFSIKVWELNKVKPLADYDVAIHAAEGSCNPQFSLAFDIAGGDVFKSTRRFRVELIHGKGSHVFIDAVSPSVGTSSSQSKTAAASTKEDEDDVRSALFIMGPYLLIIGVSVILLSVAWIVSVVIPRDRGPVTSRPRTRAILLLIYAVHRVVYIGATSLSIFAFLWYSLNGADLVVVQSYTDAVSTIFAQQEGDLRALVDFSIEQVSVQQELYRDMRSRCFASIEHLQEESVQKIQQLNLDWNQELSALPNKSDELAYLERRVMDLQSRLESHRREYNLYANSAARKLIAELGKTMDDLESNDWMSGARIIRNAVANLRSQRRSSTLLFKDWLGIRKDIGKLNANLTMDPLPAVAVSNLLPKLLEPEPYKPVDLYGVFLPRHDLYSKIKEPHMSVADIASRKSHISLFSRMSIITVVCALLVIDLLAMFCRIAGTFETGQQILDGYLLQKTFSTTYQDGCSSQKFILHKMTKNPQRVRYRLYKLITTTDFIPLLLGLLIVLGVTHTLLHVGLDFVSLSTLARVGLYSSLIGPWNLTSAIAHDNMDMNVQRINTVEIPGFELSFNFYLERMERLHSLVNNLFYHKWQMECGSDPSDRCGEFDRTKLIKPLNVKDIKCEIQPLRSSTEDIPKRITEKDVRNIVAPHISAFRHILETSAAILLTYTCYFLVVNMLGCVFWNFLTRLAVIPGVREEIINKMEDEEPSSSAAIATHIEFQATAIEDESLVASSQ